MANPLDICCEGLGSILSLPLSPLGRDTRTSADTIARNVLLLNFHYERCSVSSGEVLLAPTFLMCEVIEFLASTTVLISNVARKVCLLDYTMHVRKSTTHLHVSVRHQRKLLTVNVKPRDSRLRFDRIIKNLSKLML